MRRDWLLYIAILIFCGAAWGLTQPLAKIAVTAGYRHFGIIFWQFAIGAVLLGAINTLRGGTLPRRPAQWVFCTIIALIGTLLPNAASYTAAIHLPSGVMSIVLSLIPILAFPVALALGLDRFSLTRLSGLCLGLCAILLIALPDSSLPDREMVWWLPLALIAPLFYAVEGNFVARNGTEGLDAVQVLLGASLIGIVLAAPLAAITGQFIIPTAPLGLAEGAVILSSLAHATAYTLYVWLVTRAGSVFAAQVSYLVTGFGIFWAKLILGESYSPWVWAAVAVMLAGLALVQPRKPAGHLAAA
ncbi:EamA family transporter [Rhodobacterales bacterium LSUCC0031]|nr:EamA family transporter [Rhodobacterales bacterium LSUCC0031]